MTVNREKQKFKLHKVCIVWIIKYYLKIVKIYTLFSLKVDLLCVLKKCYNTLQ